MASGTTTTDVVSEKNALIRAKDAIGNPFLIYPITKAENVDGLDESLNTKSTVQVDGNFLSTLNIHKLTQEEYDQAIEDGTIDENALYLTPEEAVDLSRYATTDELATKADTEHSHAISDVTGLQTELDSKADSNHNHNSSYDVKGAAENVLVKAKEYTDSAVSNIVSAEHAHDDRYYTEDEIDNKITALETSIGETDNAVAQKSAIQIIVWGDDD